MSVAHEDALGDVFDVIAIRRNKAEFLNELFPKRRAEVKLETSPTELKTAQAQ